jgi:heme exporter protein A
MDERLALDGHQTLENALGFWRKIDRASGSVADFGLADLLDVPVRFLSTGQRKRAALARIAASEAPIWLLDEPLNGLDTQAVTLTEELASEHCRAGGICVIASHQSFAMAGLRTIDLADFVA